MKTKEYRIEPLLAVNMVSDESEIYELQVLEHYKIFKWTFGGSWNGIVCSSFKEKLEKIKQHLEGGK